MTDQKLTLTVFLLKPNKLPKLQAVFSAQPSYPLIAPLDGFFISLPSERHPPSWLAPVSSLIAAGTAPNLLGQSPAGVLVIQRPNKVFVVTFGHAWQQLRDDWLEIDFGRRVALNSIPRDQVVEIKADQVFAKWHVANERAPRASSVDEFGVEFDRDLVGVIGGVPDKSLGTIFGKSIRGGTSLKVSVPFNSLEAVLDTAGVQFDSDAYRKVWPEIDTIMQVTDDALIGQLDAQFNADLLAGRAQNRIVLFIPTRRDEVTSSMESYVLGRMSKYPYQTPYLTADSWISYSQKHGLPLSVEEAKSIPIHVLDDLKNEFQSNTVFECLGYELSVNGKPYFLSGGIWYEVVASFLKKINDTAKNIPLPKANVVMWNPGESERAYNTRCAQKKGYLFFDAKNVQYGGGPSKFEFCDFLDPKTKTLFFAKIATQSSGISHLVEQVRRTAELLFDTDGGYRSKLSDVFKKEHPTADRKWLNSRPENHEWKLCMVSLGKDALKLPFFARCGVVRAYNDLRRRGHLVSFTTA
ncbi:MAG TPA: TIGR04141 family sporadically distributed protein [Candidatus Angelobacter sp.]